MSTKQTIARNICWNWAGMAANMVAGFVIAPFLVSRLGETSYGLWILIASLSGYFQFLDLGVRGSVGRNMAFYRAKGDQAGINAILNSALAFTGVVALFVLGGTLCILDVFFRIFDVPEDQIDNARLALVVIGLNLAMSYSLSLFDAVLWANQRFDILNAIDIPATIVRTILTFVLINKGYGLVGLAVITLIVNVASSAAKAFGSFRVDPALRLGLRHIKGEAARCLFAFGLWFFVSSMVRTLTPQLGPLVIGSALSVRLVTPYTIAARLLTYAGSILIAATGVLTPMTTTLHAQNKQNEQRKLLLQGGRFTLMITLFFVVLFIVLGKSFIALWMGPSLAEEAFLVLSILSLGELLPMSQWTTYSMLLGMGRHRLWACMSIVEVVLAVGLALALSQLLGLVGVAIGFAVPGTICRGVVQIIYACKLVQVRAWEYAREAILPPLATAALPLLGLAALVHWRSPSRWLDLIIYAGLFALAYLICCSFLIGYKVGLNRLKLRGIQFVRGMLEAD